MLSASETQLAGNMKKQVELSDCCVPCTFQLLAFPLQSAPVSAASHSADFDWTVPAVRLAPDFALDSCDALNHCACAQAHLHTELVELWLEHPAAYFFAVLPI